MATPLPANPFEFLLVDDSGWGVTLNTDVTAYAPFVDIDNVSGLDSPDFRETFRDHEGTDGGFMDAEFEKGRDIVLSGTVYGPPGLIEPYLDNLKMSYSPRRTSTRFYYFTPGVGLRFMNVKPRGVRYDWSQARRTGQTPVQFRMFAEDPRAYDYPTFSQILPLTVYATTGFDFSFGFNFSFGLTTSASDSIIAVNEGNRPAPVKIRIYGPCNYPRLVNDTTGQVVSFNITLETADWLEVDMLNHTVKLNGVANRRTTVVDQDWFLLQPGANVIRYQAAYIPTGGSAGAAGVNLLSNPSVESGISPWTGSNANCSVLQSADYALFDSYSIKMLTDGTVQNVGPLSEFINVATGRTYTAAAWCYLPQSWIMNCAINWYDAGQVLLSSSFAPTADTFTVPANTWQRLKIVAAAPASAAYAKFRPSRTASNNIPSASFVSYTDMATFSEGNAQSFATFQWASAWR